MKRKFLNGFLAAAIIAAGSVVSSCKDYSEDDLNDLRADNLALIADLQDQINKLRLELDSRLDGNPKFKIENGDLYYSTDGGLNWTYIGRVQGEDGVGIPGATPDFKILDGVLYYSIDGGANWIKLGRVQGEDGQNGQNGENGKTPSFKIENGILYYSLDGGSNWISLGQVQGGNGSDGATPTFKIENGDLYYSLDGGNSWLYLGNVQGQNGQNGQNGQDGKTPSFKIEDGILYYSVDGGNTWVSLGKVQGENGQGGQMPTFKIENGYLYYSLDGGATWTSLGKVQGEDGNPGNPGNPGKPGDNGKTPSFKIVDGVLYYSLDGDNWISLGKVQGDKGEDGKTPIFKIVDGELYYSLDGEDWTLIGNVQGEKGKTPSFKIENGELYYSFDNGNSWHSLGKVQGEKGDPGEPGKTPTFKLEDGKLYYSINDGATWNPLGKVSGENGHSPKIQGETWWIWNDTTKSYEDTGVKAAGANGHSPKIDNGTGTWWVWNDSTNSYEDTNVKAVAIDGKTPYIKDDHWWIGTGDDAQDLGPAVGATGFSAYEVYKNNAIAAGETPMSESEWLESLKGVGILSVSMNADGITITLTDGSQTFYAFDASWKCDEEECKNAVNVIKEITKAFGYGDGVLTTAQLAELGSKITQALSDIEKALNSIEALKDRATSISVEGIKNNVFGMIKTPFGLQTNMLYGYYGRIDPDDAYDFPSTDPFVYADASIILDDSNVTLNTTNTGKGNIYLKNLGRVYYNINPTEVDFKGIDVQLTTSLGNTCGIELSKAAPSNTELIMGWTRGAASTGFYYSDATVKKFNDIEKIELPVDEFLEVVKDIKNTDKNATQDMASAIKNTLAAFKTKAYGLEISKSDYITGEDGKHTIKSPLDIQAALMKPVGFEVTAKLPSNLPKQNRAVNFVNSTINSIVNQFAKNGMVNEAKKLLSQFNGTLNHIKFGHTAGNENLIDIEIEVTTTEEFIKDVTLNFETKTFDTTTGKVTAVAHVQMKKDDFQKLFNVLNEDVDDINNMIDRANDVVKFGLDLINKLQNGGLADKFTDPIEKVIDKIWNAMNNAYGAFEYRFEQALFAESEGAIVPMRRSSMNAPLVASSFTCVMTNMNLEMLVPSFKKHIVVTDALGTSDKAAALAAVNASINQVYTGDTKKVTVSGLKSGVTYEFSYSCLDYFGKQQTRKFYVKCK